MGCSSSFPHDNDLFTCGQVFQRTLEITTALGLTML